MKARSTHQERASLSRVWTLDSAKGINKLSQLYIINKVWTELASLEVAVQPKSDASLDKAGSNSTESQSS